jgi:hypothetical protein
MLALPLLLAVAACAAPPQSGAVDAAGYRHHGPDQEHGRHHHHFTGALEGFHDVFAPLWHMDPGPERAEKACDKTAALRAKAVALEAEPVPEAARVDEAGWRTETRELVAEIDALRADCEVEGRPGLDPRLKGIHERFHQLGARVEGKR